MKDTHWSSILSRNLSLIFFLIVITALTSMQRNIIKRILLRCCRWMLNPRRTSPHLLIFQPHLPSKVPKYKF
nr:hypothetical protein Iba_scaffold22794CG0040 [Ipomoea batatas]